jgi:hypothetical protein
MMPSARSSASSLLALLLVLVVLACSAPPEHVSSPSQQTDAEARATSAWMVACVPDDTALTALDSASSMLRAASLLWESERLAFRAYQSTFCEGCALFEAEAPAFFASSSHLVTVTARRFPSSAAAACAEGLAHYRNASLGEGKFDELVLDRAVAAFERGIALTPAPVLVGRMREELANVVAVRP